MESGGRFVRIVLMLSRKILISIVFVIVPVLFAADADYGGSIEFLLPLQKITVNDIGVLFPAAVYEPLCKLNDDGTPYSNIFRSMEFNSEEFSLVLEMNENLRWNDGSAVTADQIYGSMKEFTEKNRSGGFIPPEGDILIFQAPFLKLRMLAAPDTGFYFSMSRSHLKDNTDKGRWAGPFVPYPLSNGGMILRSNTYAVSGRPFLNEIVFRPAKYEQLAVSLLSLGCGGTDFDISLPEYCKTDEESFTIRQNPFVYFLALGNGIPMNHRIRIASLLRSADFVKGVAKGNAVKIEEFPLPEVAADDVLPVQPELKPASEGAQPPAEIPSPSLCPEIEIEYFSYSVFPALADRVKAILQSAGYKAVKIPLSADALTKTERPAGNTLFIQSVDAGDVSGIPVYYKLFKLIDFFGLQGAELSMLFKEDRFDSGAFREMEKKLMGSGRLIYLFTSMQSRVFTCPVGGGEGFENYFLIKSGN